MPQTATITLTTAGADTGPFDLYSNVDGFLVPFDTGISKASLLAGYVSTLIPDAATIIRVQSTSPLCSNYIDLNIYTGTTTTTSSTSSTSTTTTTSPVYRLYWNLQSGSSSNGRFIIKQNGITIVDQTTTTSVNSGSFIINNGDTLNIENRWVSGAGNESRCRTCNGASATQIDYTIASLGDTPKTTNFGYVTSQGNIYVTLRSGGLTPLDCAA